MPGTKFVCGATDDPLSYIQIHTACFTAFSIMTTIASSTNLSEDHLKAPKSIATDLLARLNKAYLEELSNPGNPPKKKEDLPAFEKSK